jgi:hypothetical protein
MKKCPRGMFAEIKYDGERIQIHKKGEEYSFYSRNLKKMLEWKVAAVKDYITEVFPHPPISLSPQTLATPAHELSRVNKRLMDV